ncbi:MAG: ATP-binding protein, partial [Clostridia bacterium]|nr:ATP-binding protein [Clostridia bacterium]
LIEMSKTGIKQKKHHLNVILNKMEHEDVIGDSLRIQQAFMNIMSNAIKYTPEGGNIDITISEKHLENDNVCCYEFVFEDNGIGMTEEYMEHLFEPFTRAVDDRVNKIQGTGLGMAITQNVVHMMNGDIQVESAPGKGTKFTITRRT